MTERRCIRLAETQGGLWTLAREAVRDAVSRLEGGRLALHVPEVRRPFQPFDGSNHFHPRPEVFIQLCGVAMMRLVEDGIRLRAGQVLLVPRGVWHQERAEKRSGPFCNLVFSYSDRGFGFHSALGAPPRAGRGGRVRQRAMVAVRSAPRLYGYLNDAAAYVEAGYGPRHPLVRGLLMTHFAMLREALEKRATIERPHSYTVVQCRQLVWHHLSDPCLTVRWLAESIRCSADYLSHAFHTEMGKTLTRFIAEERVGLGAQLLRDTRMNVSEIAFSCGFRDPGYFARLFRRVLGQSPRSYRRAAADA